MIGVILRRMFLFPEVARIFSISSVIMFFIITPLAILLGMTGYLLPPMILTATDMSPHCLTIVRGSVPPITSTNQYNYTKHPTSANPT